MINIKDYKIYQIIPMSPGILGNPILTFNGENVLLYHNYGTKFQAWKFKKLDNDSYQIIPYTKSNLLLSYDGNILSLQEESPDFFQRWKLVDKGNGVEVHLHLEEVEKAKAVADGLLTPSSEPKLVSDFQMIECINEYGFGGEYGWEYSKKDALFRIESMRLLELQEEVNYRITCHIYTGKNETKYHTGELIEKALNIRGRIDRPIIEVGFMKPYWGQSEEWRFKKMEDGSYHILPYAMTFSGEDNFRLKGGSNNSYSPIVAALEDRYEYEKYTSWVLEEKWDGWEIRLKNSKNVILGYYDYEEEQHYLSIDAPFTDYYTYDNRSNWKIERTDFDPDETGVYRIISQKSQKALSLIENEEGDFQIKLEEIGENPSQGWSFKNFTISRSIYSSSASHLCLAGQADKKVLMEPLADEIQLNQLWNLEKLGPGYRLWLSIKKGERHADHYFSTEGSGVKLVFFGNDRYDEHDIWLIEKAPDLSYSSPKSKGITFEGFLGGVFLQQAYHFWTPPPLPPEVKRLHQLVNFKINDRFFTIDEEEADHIAQQEDWHKMSHALIRGIGDNKVYVYPPDRVGMIPMHCFYHKEANRHIFTTEDLERQILNDLESVEYKGVSCSLLPPEFNSFENSGIEIAPFFKAHNYLQDETKYIIGAKDEVYDNFGYDMEWFLSHANSFQPPRFSSKELTIGTSLDQAFGADFGPIGEAIGEALEFFDLKVEEYKTETQKTDPYWSKLLRDKDVVPEDTLDNFKLETEVYTWKTSMVNVANPDRDRITVEVQLKIMMTDIGPGFQLRLKLVGEYCLDDIIPAPVRMNQSIPEVGPFLVKDITFIFATSKTMYDPSLDAGIEPGLNLYANINFEKTDGRERPPVMQMISAVTGVKSCALHLGLGIFNVGEPKINFIAEMALQWRQYNISPLLNGELPEPPTDGLGIPSIDTKYFAARLTRSDFKITGELGMEGAGVAIEVSSDLAVELRNLKDYIGVDDANLVFTGGALLGASVDGEVSIDVGFAFTMNGTGRNTIGELTGEVLTGDKARYNTTDLSIGEPHPITIYQAATELKISVVLGDPPRPEPKVFGIMAKGSFREGKVKGEIAFKVDLDNPDEFILIIDVNDLTIPDFLLLCSTLFGGPLGRTVAQLVPEDWIDEVNDILDITLEKGLLYFVPSESTIGGVVYEDTGYVLAGKVDIYGWKAQLYAVYDKKSGATLAAGMDSLEIEVEGYKIFSVDRSDRSKQEEEKEKKEGKKKPNSLKNATMAGNGPSTFKEALEIADGDSPPPSEEVPNGPRMACTLMAPGLQKESKIELLVDARIEFLSVAAIDIYLLLEDGKFTFATSVEFGPLKADLDATFDTDYNGGLRLTGGGGISVANIDFPSVDLGPLGTVDFGKFTISARFDVDTSMSANGAEFSFKLKLTFEYSGEDFSPPEIKLKVTFDWSNLKDEILDTVKDKAEDIFGGLFGDAGKFLGAIADGVVSGVEDVGGVLKDSYNLTENGAAKVLEGAGYAVDEAGEIVEGTYKLGKDGVGTALKGAGYATEEVGGWIKSTFFDWW